MYHQNVSSKFLIKKYHHNVCLKCLIQCLIKCLMKLYNQNVSSKRLIKMSYQKISSKCFIKMSHQNVLGNGNFRKNASEPQSRLMKTTVGFLLQDFYKIKNFHKLVNFAVFLLANFCTVKKIATGIPAICHCLHVCICIICIISIIWIICIICRERLDNLSIFKDQINIRSIVSVTPTKTTNNQANIEPSRFSNHWFFIWFNQEFGN